MWPSAGLPQCAALLSLVDSDRCGGSGFLVCSSGGSDMFRTLSRMICRIVFRKALRNSDVLHYNIAVTSCSWKKLNRAVLHCLEGERIVFHSLY